MLEYRLRNLGLVELKTMSYTTFQSTILHPLNNLREPVFKRIICGLPAMQFKLLTQKCWEEQCQPRDETIYCPEDELQAMYESTLPIIFLLERMINARLTLEQDAETKQSMTQQLSLLNMITKPNLFEDIKIE